MSPPSSFPGTGVISLNPLVTFTKRHPPTPIGLVGGCPELFAGRRSLHFISVSWTLYPADIEEIAREWRRVSGLLPEAMIVFMTNSDYDLVRLSKEGVPAMACNSAMFVDEQVFKPVLSFDFSDAAYDAIYNARFAAYKRHELARLIDNLALIYDESFDEKDAQHESATRAALPRAHYINHEHGRGRYVRLDKKVIALEVNRARCGLCLSSVEGSMCGSMEYLLCGIPVVSTHSLGGRDRYYQAPYVIEVADDAQAVREAVGELKRRKLNKLAIRDHVGCIVEFERRNFLKAVNDLARAHFGVGHLFESLASFIKAEPFTAPQEEWSRRKLAPVAEALGVKLPPPVRAESTVST